jgi:amino acid permease
MFRSFILTASFVAITCALAIGFPNVTNVLSIMGGLCSVTLCYTIPGRLFQYYNTILVYCHVKLSDKHWTHVDNLSAILFFGVLIVLGYCSVVDTVYTIATGGGN